MGKVFNASKDCEPSSKWLCSKFQISAKAGKESKFFESISKPSKGGSSEEIGRRNDSEESNNLCRKGSQSGFLQSSIPGTQTRKQMETSNRSEFAKSLPSHLHFQDGDCGMHSSISKTGRMGLLNRHKGRVFPCSYPSKLSKIPSVSDPKRHFSVSCSSLWGSHGSARIHNDRKRSQTSSLFNGNSHAPIFGRLVNKSRFRRAMSHRYSKIDFSGARIGVVGKFRKVGISPNTKPGFSGLPFQFDSCIGFSHGEKVTQTTRKNSLHQESTVYHSKTVDVVDRDVGMFREDGAIGKTSLEAFPMASEKVLEVSRFPGENNSSNSGSSETHLLVGIQTKSAKGIATSSHGKHSVNLHRCFSKGMGCPPATTESQRVMDRARAGSTHKSFRDEGSFLSFKRLQGDSKRSKSASVFRQYVRRKLPEQTRWHKILSNGSSCMENNDISKCHGDPDKSETRPRQLECHSRLPVSQRQDHSVRMVVTPSNFSGNLSGMAHSHSRHVCHIKECKASSLCFSNTRYKCVAGRCSEHSMGKSRRVCFLPCSSHTPSDSKNDDLPVHNDCHSTGMAGDGMVLGLGGTVSKAPPQAAALAKHAETATQPHVSQKSRLSKPSRVVSPIRAKERRSRFSAKVEARIAAPQRKSSRAVYKSRWAIYEQWCLQNKMDSTKSSVSQIADFLLFLFEQKSLSPSTVSGYRTAIADRLGSGSDKISKSRDLNRLLASFHRDRPRIGKSIPTWDLSLVLLALTKKPFEPLNQAQLKFLTLKTVFLLALASGKRRSEIHAWTHASVFFRSDGSKVTVAPSSAFLAKNQLASDGPSSVQQVVIPALSSIVDSTLTQDISLCPVRALRIYLDRTQSIRKGKDLLFVSLKTGFTKDIARATISHWIKRTVQLCYQFADSETLQLSRVKAHDVRALAASLAFKGGVALDEILNSCYWRSHGTFTNFYLKDVCWENENVFKLGPLVAAQHIVSSM